MIKPIYGKRQKEVTCDNCGTGFEAEDFDAAKEIMRDEGWKTKKVDGAFCHYCPDCVEGGT